MNIAVVIKTRELSGTQKRSAKIASALNDRGHLATLFLDEQTHRALTTRDYRFDWPNIVVWSYPFQIRALGVGGKSFAHIRDILGLSRLDLRLRKRYWTQLFKEHKIDVAHLYIKWRMCQEMPIPHIFEITSPDIARNIIKQGNPFPPQTLLHPNSEGVASVLESLHLSNETSVAPHAYFDPNEPSDFVPPKKENLIVFAHRLVERKNPVLFAKAAKRFLAERPDWRIAVRGEGPLSEEVQQILADEIQLGRALFGFEPNLMDELYRSRIFVSIESEDNYSNQSVLEAMWCRNALVLSDRGRTKARYFANNGVLCEPEEESVFAALIDLADDTSGLASKAANSRRHVETAFSRDEYLNHLESVYRLAMHCRGDLPTDTS